MKFSSVVDDPNFRGANAPRGSLKLARLPHAKGRLAARPQFADHVSVAICAQPFTRGNSSWIGKRPPSSAAHMPSAL